MPIRTGAARAVEQIQEVFRRRERATADLATVRVEGRNEDGTTQIQRLDGECVGRGCADDHYAGETFEHPRRTCFSGSTGTSGVALISQRGGANALWVERLDPSVFPQGTTLDVDVVGYGFQDDTQFEFLLPGTFEPNPFITIDDQVLVSSELVTLTIVIDQAAPPIVNAPLAFDNPGEPF